MFVEGGSVFFISVFFLKIDLNREAPYFWCLFWISFLSKIRGYVIGVWSWGGGSGLFINVFFLKIYLNREAPYFWNVFYQN